MNYIEQINAFWEKVENDQCLKPSAIVVYMALLRINNKCGWKETFKVDYCQVINLTGVAKNTYYSAIKELVENDYIHYTPGTNQYLAAQFTIKMLYQNLGKQRESTGKALRTHQGNQRESTANIPKHLNLETNKHLNNNEEVEVNARAAEIENAITDFCEVKSENSEKEKNSAQKEKELPPVAEAMEKVAGMAVWRNCVEHHGITEDDRPKLFKIFYEQKEDAYKIRYPTVTDMAKNFYYWISTIKKLNKLNDLLNGNEPQQPTFANYKNTNNGRTSSKDKHAELRNLAGQSNEFLRRTAGS